MERCALASGLLTEQQIEEARAAASQGAGSAAPDEQRVADCLVELGLLNPWQAKQLLDGRTKFNLGPYRIIDSIGQGGMGQVFKAEHELMGRVVAVKVLPRDKSTPDSIANFTREIQSLAKLDHRKLVRALDAGHDGNVYYLVTEYVPGCDLRKLVRRDGPLGMEFAASIISQVAEGLQHAHQQGLVHRDVKPGNVLVTPEGEAKLSDLGLAGPLNPEHDPRAGKIVGTADYLSPDHIMCPWQPTPGWDIYSLGCTLYYAVTGKVPFPGGSTAEKARAHCDFDMRPLDPRRLNPALSDSFVDVVADMMAKDPGERIPSAEEAIKSLSPWVRLPVPVVGSAQLPETLLPAVSPPAVSRSEVPRSEVPRSEAGLPGVAVAPGPILAPPIIGRPIVLPPLAASRNVTPPLVGDTLP
ncbi:MAG: protein kinase, partial [Thermoguttaceae bacterium]